MLGGPGAGRCRLHAACRHGSLRDRSCQAWAVKRERCGGLHIVVPLRRSRAAGQRWAACTGDSKFCSARSGDAAGHGDLHARDRERCILITRPGRGRRRLRPAVPQATARGRRSDEASDGGRRRGIGSGAGDILPCLLSRGGVGRQDARAGGSRRPVSRALRGCCIHREGVGPFARRSRRSRLRQASRGSGVTGPVQPGQAGSFRQQRRPGAGGGILACCAVRSQGVLVRSPRQLAAVHLCGGGRLAWHGAGRQTRRDGYAGWKRACDHRDGQRGAG